MKKSIPYIVGFFLAAMGLMPPLHYSVAPPNYYWPWMVMIAGFFGFYLLFINTSWIVKIMGPLLFINASLSVSFFESFTQYICVVACLYFFVLCERIEAHRPVFKILQCLLIFHCFMFLVQATGHDKVLNFYERTQFGVLGQTMQSASFMTVLAAVLMPYWIFNIAAPLIISFICHSAGAFISAFMGLAVLCSKLSRSVKITIAALAMSGFAIFFVEKIVLNIQSDNGRLAIWLRSLALMKDHVIFGWGIGTFKFMFPALSNIHNGDVIPWMSAHNCWVQLLFELGIFGFSVVVFYAGFLYGSLFKLLGRATTWARATACLSGLVMITCEMVYHFPTRMIQTVPLIIFFLSYCEKVIIDGAKQIRHSE